MAYGLTQSINFASASNQCAYRADDPDVLGNMTGETWVKFTTLPTGGGSMRLMTKDDFSGQRTFGWSVVESGGSYVYTLRWFGGGTDGTVTSSSFSLSTGVWYHMGFARSSGTNGPVTFFLDAATPTGGNTVTGNLNNTTSDFMVGAGGSNGSPMQPLNGRMSLARLWTTVLNSATFQSNQCSVLGSTTNLEAEWTFDNTYNDNSGNSNTLTGVNTPTFVSDVPAVCAPVNTTNFFVMM